MAQELEFYDVKSRSKFKTTEYRIEEKTSTGKNGNEITRYFAVTKSPTGDYECWKILGKDLAAQLKSQ